jgi:hypothetical protein
MFGSFLSEIERNGPDTAPNYIYCHSPTVRTGPAFAVGRAPADQKRAFAINDPDQLLWPAACTGTAEAGIVGARGTDGQ